MGMALSIVRNGCYGDAAARFESMLFPVPGSAGGILTLIDERGRARLMNVDAFCDKSWTDTFVFHMPSEFTAGQGKSLHSYNEAKQLVKSLDAEKAIVLHQIPKPSIVTLVGIRDREAGYCLQYRLSSGIVCESEPVNAPFKDRCRLSLSSFGYEASKISFMTADPFCPVVLKHDEALTIFL